MHVRIGARIGCERLGAGYPDPITSLGAPVTIQYQIVADTHVRLRLFNVLGKEVARLVDADQSYGQYTIAFSAQDLPNGTIITHSMPACFTARASLS